MLADPLSLSGAPFLVQKRSDSGAADAQVAYDAEAFFIKEGGNVWLV